MEKRKKRMNGSVITGAVAVVLAVLVLVFAVNASSVAPGAAPAPSVVSAAQEATAAADDDATSNQTASRVVAAGAAVAASTADSVNETIEDDDTPLGAYPLTNPLDGFTWVLLAAILGASIFFVVSTRRANRDITAMRSAWDSF